MTRTGTRIVIGLALAALTPTALATDFCEGEYEMMNGMEAGSFPFSAINVTGMGVLENIRGCLCGLPSGACEPGSCSSGGPDPDFQDMYRIRVRSPTFLATTTGQGSAGFDTVLWVFEPLPGDQAGGLLANDNSPVPGPLGSTLTAESNDGTGIVLAPGEYYIAITSVGSQRDVPQSEMGDIFLIVDPQEISGPDGPGGPLPLVKWTGPGKPMGTAEYVIHFESVGFIGSIPTVTEWGLIVMALALLLVGAVVIRRQQAVVPAPQPVRH